MRPKTIIAIILVTLISAILGFVAGKENPAAYLRQFMPSESSSSPMRLETVDEERQRQGWERESKKSHGSGKAPVKIERPVLKRRNSGAN